MGKPRETLKNVTWSV